MGTTESIFLDSEEGEDHSRHRSSLPTASPDNSVHQTGQRRRVHVGSSADHRLSTGATPVPNELAGHPRRPPPSPNRPYSSPLSQHAVAEKEHVRRHNVKPSQDGPYAPSCLQLDGMIVGKAKSGKRTLLQRLEGKEPQFNVSRTTPRRRNGDMESIKSDDVDSLETVTAPYQAPVNLPTFDEMIQLQVSASTKVVKKTPHDFYVVLIDPRHDRSKVQKFLTKTLQSALRSQGYQRETENTSDTSAESVVTRRPFCLCLLRNFGDLVVDAHNNTASTNGGGSEREIITDSDLTTWTMDVLENFTLDESLLQLQCASVSLYNCYGLGVLHHFIYQSYLHRKRYDANVQLRHMNEALIQSKRDAPGTVSYQQYLKDMEQLLQNQSATASNRPNPVGSAAQSVESSSTSIRGDDDTATTATSSGVAATASSRRQIIAPPRSPRPQQQQGDNVSPSRTNANVNPEQAARASWGDSSSQSTLASLPQQPMDHAKEMLEAFLESDSSEDDNENVNDISQEVEDNTKDDTETTSVAASPPIAKPPLHSVIMTASANGESELHATPKAKDRRVVVRPLSLRRFDSDDESDDDFYVNDNVEEQQQHIDEKETAPQLDDPVTVHTKQDAGQESKSDDAGAAEPERQSLSEQVGVECEGGGGGEAHVNDTASPHRLDANDVDLSNGKKPVDDADCKVSTAPLDGASPADDVVDQDRDANHNGAVAMAAAQSASSPLSEAARAAIAAAQEDFERMLEQTERELTVKNKKSKKSDGKKKSKKDKKASVDE